MDGRNREACRKLYFAGVGEDGPAQSNIGEAEGCGLEPVINFRGGSVVGKNKLRQGGGRGAWWFHVQGRQRWGGTQYELIFATTRRDGTDLADLFVTRRSSTFSTVHSSRLDLG
jgi:hypothetical protein